MTNLDIIRSTYEGPSAENGKHLVAALASDAEWVEAAGFPYAGTYVGPEAIAEQEVNESFLRGALDEDEQTFHGQDGRPPRTFLSQSSPSE